MITAAGSISHVRPSVFPITVRRISTVLNTSESNSRTECELVLLVATVQCGYGSLKPTTATAVRGSMRGSNRAQYALLSEGGVASNGNVRRPSNLFVRNHSTVQWRI